jgi:hypothetical protein
MDRRIATAIVLGLIGWVGVNASCAQGISRVELQERVKAHINERMYDCCRSVTLTERPDGTYEGFAFLINGVQSPLEVRVSGRDIAYTFTKLTPPTGLEPDDSQQPHNGPSVAPGPPAEDVTFTSSMYTQLQKGMTYRQVVDALGSKGEQLSSSYFDGVANQVYVWANSDDSHICVVFRDGTVLVKTQSGLPGIAPLPPLKAPKDDSADFGRFKDWQLAQETNGRMTLLGLSLSQWLEKVSRTLSSGGTGAPTQVEIVEQDDELAVKLAKRDPQGGTHDRTFYLACLSPDDTGIEVSPGAQIEVLCVPSRMMIDGNESGPAQAWKAMAELAGLNQSRLGSSTNG